MVLVSWEGEEAAMNPEDDPVIRLLLGGVASTLHDAEEMYLDGCLPQLLELLQGPLSEEELNRHPLVTLLVSHGSRGREDSLL
jgi:hypothetical protein